MFTRVHDLNGAGPLIASRIARKLAPKEGKHTRDEPPVWIGIVGAALALFFVGSVSTYIDYFAWQAWWVLGLACAWLPALCWGILAYGLARIL